MVQSAIMTVRQRITFLDFGTLGPGIDPKALEAFGEVTYFDYTPDKDVSARLAKADIVVCNKTSLDSKVLRGAKDLRLIVLAATGTDNVDLVEARKRGIAVYNIRDYCTPSVAQHVFALILGLTHRVNAYHDLVKEGAWSRSDVFCLFDFPFRELAGRSIGLIGYGALGKGVGRVAKGFGMDVLVSGRRGDMSTPRDRIPFREVLQQADIVSLHCPLVAETRNMIGTEELALMKSDALLINTARGGLVDAPALVRALEEGAIGGAGIDVLPEEPPETDHPFVTARLDNLIITPHVAWAARESRQRAVTQMAENIRSFMAGEDRRRVV